MATAPLRPSCAVCAAVVGGVCLSVLAVKMVRKRSTLPPRFPAGKHVILTGASSGIGREAAQILLDEGANLTLLGRNEQRTRAALAPAAKFSFVPLDLCSLQSVRDCAKKIRALNQPVDVLILNAGVYNREQKCTLDGFEETFQVNHLANFLLVQDLWDVLIASHTRVVVVSSDLHRKVSEVSLDSLMDINGPFNGYRRYAETKLLNILFSKEVARRFGESGATAVSVRPGFIPATSLFRTELTHRPWLRLLLPIVSVFTKTPTDGARAVLYAAFQKDIPSGSYVQLAGVEAPAAAALDAGLAQRLWDWSKRLL